MEYVQSPQGVFVRGGRAESIAYPDGDAIEQSILRIVEEAKDLSSLSEELHSAAFDWPTEYHLSRQRHVLIRPVGIQPGDRVLELGAGCGAITRYLGELGAQVDAVEGSFNRARIAASRTRDLPNVRVFCDHLMEFDSSEKYKWVLLVGVLEYSPMFIAAEDPVLAALAKARQHLAEQGRLVVAIENRMGLKYLNGANEDHLGIPFVGVERRYGPMQPTTFSREELLARCEAVGLTDSTVLLPFPDYKLPTTIVNADAAERGARVAEAMLSMESTDHGVGRSSSFNERLVRRSIADSSLLADLSDSFLVISSPAGVSPIMSDGLIWHYSLGTRKSKFACETLVLGAPDLGGSLRVMKMRLDGTSHEIECGEGDYLHRVPQQKFARGISIASRFVDALVGCDTNGVGRVVQETVDEYMRCLVLLAGISPTDSNVHAQRVVEGALLDCIPRNVVIDDSSDRTPTFIDQEWAASGTILLSRVLFRAALDLQHVAATFVESGQLGDLIRDAFRSVGLDDALWALHMSDEHNFQNNVASEQSVHVGQYAGRTSFATVLQNLNAERDGLVAERDGLVAERDGLIAERDGLVAERDGWRAQFHRLRARRSVRLALGAVGLWTRLNGQRSRGYNGAST